MKLNHGLHLAYCTNIHRGENWAETFAALQQHTLAVRDRLVSLGIDSSRLTIDASGSNDPLPADSPAERARLNRSASFVVRAQPSARAGGTERVR